MCSTQERLRKQLLRADAGESACCRALEDLAPFLNGKALEQALQTSTELRPFWRKHALAALAPPFRTTGRRKSGRKLFVWLSMKIDLAHAGIVAAESKERLDALIAFEITPADL